ncbi:MAG: hypothetical protein IJR99_13850 [Kiritimatiellae bacterium]|nr:hypothetical protein [Kiritimatiellia bacterium]
MKGIERMKEMKMNHGLHGQASLTLAMWGVSAHAATGGALRATTKGWLNE